MLAKHSVARVIQKCTDEQYLIPKMPTVSVKYDNNSDGVYYSGQQFSGTILLDNEKKRKIRGVTFRIEGYAKCKWTESEGSGKHRRTVHYYGREDYLNTFSYLIGSFESSEVELSAGAHKFNFMCALPPQLPTSFESKYGYIRYQIIVEIERPWKTDQKFCYAFTVIRNIDLNYENPTIRQPFKVDTVKSFFLGFSSKNLNATAETAVTGYVSGQEVPISINVNNESNVEVTEVLVNLIRNIHYNSDSPRRKIKERIENVAVVKYNGVQAKSKASAQIPILIPPTPPTNIGLCRVLNVFYEIHVTLRVGGLHRNPVLKIPITIGTVPLMTLPTPNQPISQAPSQTLGWATPSTSSAQSPLYLNLPVAPSAPAPSSPEQYDMPPPSYHEVMAIAPTQDEGDADEGLHDQQPFNPSYPVYNFNQFQNNQQTYAYPLVPQPPPNYTPSLSDKQDLSKF